MSQYFTQPPNAQTHFAHTVAAEIERSSFDRSHGLKSTFDAGYLVPIFWDEVLPGDSFQLRETSFTRLATPLRPFMDNLYYETFYFFVPNRLIWDKWPEFMGERKHIGDDPSTLRVPHTMIDLSKNLSLSLSCYLGIPRNGSGSVKVSTLPFRAYALIFNEWFRDENLVEPMYCPTDDGPDNWEFGGAIIPPVKRGKRHDYFTSSLPWPQKGDPVVIPVGPIVGTGLSPSWKSVSGGLYAGNTFVTASNALQKGSTAPGALTEITWNDPKLAVQQDPGDGAATIADLRTAFQIQKLLERDARGGTRYIEIILAHFGVRSDDARLQRPEYLGGGRTRINVNPVAANFRDSNVAQGDLAGFATGLNRGSWSKSFTEHGIVMGIACVRADLTYQNGLAREWQRFTRLDFYWPAFAHLGEQAVHNKEIFLTGGDQVLDNMVWGYQERYAEYRFKPSRITGKMLSNDAQSLDVWHLAQDFDTLPVLNADFIAENPPVDRVVAVPDQPHFLLDAWFDYKCARPMPVYTVPGLVDHF